MPFDYEYPKFDWFDETSKEEANRVFIDMTGDDTEQKKLLYGVVEEDILKYFPPDDEAMLPEVTGYSVQKGFRLHHKKLLAAKAIREVGFLPFEHPTFGAHRQVVEGDAPGLSEAGNVWILWDISASNFTYATGYVRGIYEHVESISESLFYQIASVYMLSKDAFEDQYTVSMVATPGTVIKVNGVMSSKRSLETGLDFTYESDARKLSDAVAGISMRRYSSAPEDIEAATNDMLDKLNSKSVRTRQGMIYITDVARYDKIYQNIERFKKINDMAEIIIVRIFIKNLMFHIIKFDMNNRPVFEQKHSVSRSAGLQLRVIMPPRNSVEFDVKYEYIDNAGVSKSGHDMFIIDETATPGETHVFKGSGVLYNQKDFHVSNGSGIFSIEQTTTKVRDNLKKDLPYAQYYEISNPKDFPLIIKEWSREFLVKEMQS